MSSNSFITVVNQQGHEEIVRYDVFVALLFKQEATRQMLDHARAGICEEAGELSSVIKRNVVYGQALTDPMKEDGKPLLTHIIEELGDIRFFMQAVQNMYGIPEQAILQHNANKLAARYNQLMYSDVAAITRLDKDTGPVAAG